MKAKRQGMRDRLQTMNAAPTLGRGLDSLSSLPKELAQ